MSLNFEANQPGLNGLTSGGQPTHYQVNGNVIILLDAGGKTILTVTLGLDGKYQVVLDGVLDQPVSTNSVNLGLQVQGTDFDGDKEQPWHPQYSYHRRRAAPGRPRLPSPWWRTATGTRPRPSPGIWPSPPGPTLWSTSHSMPASPACRGLTSGGQPVVITISGNSISGAVNGQNVFTLTLDQNGHYVFTLNQPLDRGVQTVCSRRALPSPTVTEIKSPPP